MCQARVVHAQSIVFKIGCFIFAQKQTTFSRSGRDALPGIPHSIQCLQIQTTNVDLRTRNVEQNSTSSSSEERQRRIATRNPTYCTADPMRHVVVHTHCSPTSIKSSMQDDALRISHPASRIRTHHQFSRSLVHRVLRIGFSRRSRHASSCASSYARLNDTVE